MTPQSTLQYKAEPQASLGEGLSAASGGHLPARHKDFRRFVPIVSIALASGCAAEPALTGTGGSRHGNSEDAGGEPTVSSAPDPLSAALGQGELESLTFTQLFAAPERMFCVGGVCTTGIPTDLGFNPVRPKELWAVFRQPEPPGPCEMEGDTSGCAYLHGKVAIISEADSDAPEVQVAEDGNSWHFMRLSTTLAFADDDTFATVGEDRTGNFHDSSVDYMGPTLWSSDPAIFAVDFGTNGSHLDMLHASPYGMGIAHQEGHVFFVFNGQSGAIDAYDFKQPHEPGGEDHSDGTLLRYVEGQVARQPGVPSHMEFLEDKTTLLIADTGNQRVVSLDTKSGRLAERIGIDDAQIADPRRIADATLTEIVTAGKLEQPSGLVVGPQSFAVGDTATGKIHQFTFDGEALVTLDLRLDPGVLGGLELGPDGKLYFTRKDENSVVRIDF